MFDKSTDTQHAAMHSGASHLGFSVKKSCVRDETRLARRVDDVDLISASGSTNSRAHPSRPSNQLDWANNSKRNPNLSKCRV